MKYAIMRNKYQYISNILKSTLIGTKFIEKLWMQIDYNYLYLTFVEKLGMEIIYSYNVISEKSIYHFSWKPLLLVFCNIQHK